MAGVGLFPAGTHQQPFPNGQGLIVGFPIVGPILFVGDLSHHPKAAKIQPYVHGLQFRKGLADLLHQLSIVRHIAHIGFYAGAGVLGQLVQVGKVPIFGGFLQKSVYGFPAFLDLYLVDP